MGSNGIRDRVAIIGMGCTPFGEHWDKGVDDLLVDSTQEALHSAGVALADVDAFWLGTMGSGQSGASRTKKAFARRSRCAFRRRSTPDDACAIS